MDNWIVRQSPHVQERRISSPGFHSDLVLNRLLAFLSISLVHPPHFGYKHASHWNCFFALMSLGMALAWRGCFCCVQVVPFLQPCTPHTVHVLQYGLQHEGCWQSRQRKFFCCFRFPILASFWMHSENAEAGCSPQITQIIFFDCGGPLCTSRMQFAKWRRLGRALE